VGNKIENEPVSKWWVCYILQKLDRTIKRVKTYHRRTRTFGVELPRTVEETLVIKKKGAYIWRRIIEWLNSEGNLIYIFN